MSRNVHPLAHPDPTSGRRGSLEQDRAMTQRFCSNAAWARADSLPPCQAMSPPTPPEGASDDLNGSLESNNRTGFAPLVGARGAGDGPVRDDPRRGDRERRAAVDPGGSRLLAGGPAVGGHRLHDPLRRCASARRAARRPARVGGVCSSRAWSVFTAASLFNGLAWNDMSLIVGRAIQGLGAALLVPAALSVLVTIFPEGRERNRALGIWAAATAGRRIVRTAARRRADGRPQLGVDLLHQHPDRRAGDRAHARLPAGESGGARPSGDSTSRAPRRSPAA